MNLKSIAATAVLLVAAISPAKAMSVTFTDVAGGQFSYEAQAGISSVSWSVSYGPGNSDPYWSCYCLDPRGIGDISGDFFISGPIDSFGQGIVQAGFPIGNHAPGLNLFCDRSEICTTTGTFSHFFESGLLTFFLSAMGSYGREFLTSSITFTGPNPIPLPAALPLFGAALAGLGFLRWRHRA